VTEMWTLQITVPDSYREFACEGYSDGFPTHLSTYKQK